MYPILITIIIVVASIVWNRHVNGTIKKFSENKISFYCEELKKVHINYVNNGIEFTAENKDELWKDPKKQNKNALLMVGFIVIACIVGFLLALPEIDLSTVSTGRLILGILSPLFFLIIFFILYKFGRQRNYIDQITLKQNVLEITLLNDKNLTTQDVKIPTTYQISDISLKYKIIFNNISDSLSGRKKNYYLYIKDNTSKTRKYALLINDDRVENDYRVFITFANILSRSVATNRVQSRDEVEAIIQYSCK